MSKFYNTDDIIKLFQKQDDKIEDLECLFDKCCSKIPINIGNGIGLFNRLYRNKWEFKSLIAGSNITITDNGNDLTITGSVAPVTCDDIDTCLGISALGDPDKYLNEQGDWQTITIPTNYITSVSDTSTVDLTVSAGNLTADVKLNTDYIGFGDSNNQLTGDTNFKFNSTTGLVLNKPTFGLSSTATSALLRNQNFVFEIAGDGFSMYEYGGAGEYFFIDADSKLYSFGDLTGGTAKLDIDGAGSFISLDSPFTYITNLATPGTLMVVADGTGLLSKQTIPTGTVTSVDMSVPTGLSISGNPITTSGTLALSLTSGYVIPTTTEETNWNTAYTNRITSLTTTGSSGASTLISNTLNIPNYTIDGLLPSQTSNSGKYLTTDGTNASWSTISTSASLSGLTAATATNTIANANYAQTWNWDTLSTQTALKIASSSLTSGSLLNLVSTSTATNGEIGLNVNMSGTNANAGRTSTGIYVSQTKVAGNTGSDYGIDVSLSGAGNVANKIGIRCITSGGTNWGYTGYGAYISNTTIGSTQTGLFAEANNGNSVATIGVHGKSGGVYSGGTSYGVKGESLAAITTSYGVYGVAAEGITSSSNTCGVYGRSGGQSTGSVAVRYGGYFIGEGYQVGGVLATPTVVGVYASASGGLTNNYGLLVAAGSVGIGTTTPTSTIDINGSFARAYVTKTANYTLTTSDFGVICDTNSFTITLPTATTATHREYFIKQIGSGTTITIATTSSQTIDGAVPSTYNLTTQYSRLCIFSDGSNWLIKHQ